MSLGFEQAGFDVLAAIDLDPVHLAVHQYNFPCTEVLCADLSRLSVTQVETVCRKGWSAFKRDGEWDGTIDCLFGGPSCQGFSVMGRLDEGDARNKLIVHFARLIDALRPRSFVIENVPGLASPRYSRVVNNLYRRLRRAGYTLQETGPAILDAADFGVPQWRKRVFIVGALDGVEVPAPLPVEGPTVRQALDDLPKIEEYDVLFETDTLVLRPEELERMSSTASEYAASLRRQHAFEYARDWRPEILTGCQRTQHRPEVRARFDQLSSGAEDAPSRTHRLNGSGKSRTLRAGTGRDHGSFTAPRPIHHSEPRVITIREAARLHSFPDWFRFHVTKWHGLRQIGNAVPPRLAAAVAGQVIDAIDQRPVAKPERALPVSDQTLLKMSLDVAAEYYGLSRDKLPTDSRRTAGHRGSG